MPLSRLKKRKYLKSKILPFYQSLSYTKQEIGVGYHPLQKKKTNSKYILLFFIFYLSQFPAHIHRFKRAKSLQKVKHKIVNTFYYPYCDAL